MYENSTEILSVILLLFRVLCTPSLCWFLQFPPVITGNCSPDFHDMMQFSNSFYGPTGKYSHMITTMRHFWSFMSRNELMMLLNVVMLKFMNLKEM